MKKTGRDGLRQGAILPGDRGVEGGGGGHGRPSSIAGTRALEASWRDGTGRGLPAAVGDPAGKRRGRGSLALKCRDVTSYD